MIKANELRVGNWILENEESHIAIQTTSHNIELAEKGTVHFSVPISDFGLLRLGYIFNRQKEQYEYTAYGFASNFPVWNYKDEWHIAPMGDGTGYITLVSVHQLQNIIFSLSGIEITTNRLLTQDA